MCAHRRSRNLRDLLVNAKCTYPETITRRLPAIPNTTCPTITCKYCRMLKKQDTIMSSFLDIEIRTIIHCRTSCLTPNVIYSITCLKCLSQYVGETKRQLRKRMYEHLKTIQEHGNSAQITTPVSTHFNKVCKRPAKLEFQILETIKGNPDELSTTLYRKRREKWWILNLRSLDPLGINVLV